MADTNPTTNHQEKDNTNIRDNNTVNQNKSTTDTSKEKDNSKPAEQKEPEPTLAEDYENLKQMHLLRNVMIRMQYGRYPNKKIDGILKRRMDLDESKFQGTNIVRIIISIMASFFICSFIYVIIWLIANSMNLNDLKDTSSLVISLFFLSSCGFLIFNNISVPDEKKLKEAINEKMKEIENELKKENKNDTNKSEKQS